MSRHPTPERLAAAQRAGVHARLVSAGCTAETADAWLDAWAAQAATEGLAVGGRYWDAGWQWIAAQRAERRRP